MFSRSYGTFPDIARFAAVSKTWKGWNKWRREIFTRQPLIIIATGREKATWQRDYAPLFLKDADEEDAQVIYLNVFRDFRSPGVQSLAASLQAAAQSNSPWNSAVLIEGDLHDDGGDEGDDLALEDLFTGLFSASECHMLADVPHGMRTVPLACLSLTVCMQSAMSLDKDQVNEVEETSMAITGPEAVVAPLWAMEEVTSVMIYDNIDWKSYPLTLFRRIEYIFVDSALRVNVAEFTRLKPSLLPDLRRVNGLWVTKPRRTSEFARKMMSAVRLVSSYRLHRYPDVRMAFVGLCVALPRDRIENLGSFPESITMPDEWEKCYRIRVRIEKTAKSRCEVDFPNWVARHMLSLFAEKVSTPWLQ